jgi:hypothetical protein
MIGMASGYLSPACIANPKTGECRYYFAGDWKHHNPIPNGTWYMVGIVGETINNCTGYCLYYTQEGYIWHGLECGCLGTGEEGCENWCKIKEGEWVKDDSRCKCQIGMEWKAKRGCIKESDSYPAIETISDLKGEPSEYGGGGAKPPEETAPSEHSGSNDIPLWIKLGVVVIVTLMGVIYCIAKKYDKE